MSNIRENSTKENSSEDSLNTDSKKFAEFEDDDKSDNASALGASLEDDEDDYNNMLGGRQTKTLDKGKVGSKSKRGKPTKDPKAIITADQKSCTNNENCAACIIF